MLEAHASAGRRASTELTRQLRDNQKKPAKPSSNPKEPDPFAFPDADPFDFTGEDEDRPIQKLVQQKQSEASSSAGEPSRAENGAAEASLPLHLSKNNTGYLYVVHVGTRYKAEIRSAKLSLGSYNTAVEAAAAVARHLHLQGTEVVEEEEEEEEESEYAVECVLEQRKRGQKTEYLVKWQGYDRVEDITWEPAASLNDTAALEVYLEPRLDLMGNRWSLGDASVSVQPAGSDDAVTLATPAPPTALACDFGGYVWLLAGSKAAGSKLYRLDPRGPGYTDDGMARRDCPGEALSGCVGAYHGDRDSHKTWVEVALPEAPLALQPPRASDHVVITLTEAGPREVRRMVHCLVPRLVPCLVHCLVQCMAQRRVRCRVRCMVYHEYTPRRGRARSGLHAFLRATTAAIAHPPVPHRPTSPPASPPRHRWRLAQMARCGWRGRRRWTRVAGARCPVCYRAPTTTSPQQWWASTFTSWAARCGGAASPRESTCSTRCGG